MDGSRLRRTVDPEAPPTALESLRRAAAACWSCWGPTRTGCAKSFRNIARVVVLPARSVGVADVVGAATMIVSEAALEELAQATTETVRAASAESAG